MAELGRRTFTLSDKDLRFPKELTLQEFSPTSVQDFGQGERRKRSRPIVDDVKRNTRMAR